MDKKQKLPKHIVAFESKVTDDDSLVLVNKNTNKCLFSSDDSDEINEIIDMLDGCEGWGYDYGIRNDLIGKQIVF